MSQSQAKQHQKKIWKGKSSWIPPINPRRKKGLDGRSGPCMPGKCRNFPILEMMAGYSWWQLTYSEVILKSAREAGIDPRFLMAILSNEVNASADFPIADLAIQGGSWMLDKLNLYGRLKSRLGIGGSPPSLGWGNIQESTFNRTKDAHPGSLDDIDWTDMIWSNEDAIKVTAFVLRDLADDVSANASRPLLDEFSVTEVAAAGYQQGYGKGGLADYYRTGDLDNDPDGGRAYAQETMKNFWRANALYCHNMYWEC